ncbi:MAG: hypothetical protein H6607_08460 [Flavobacteriales bacterium]|nr:hypothetical protein [Flavobacteriales bacterium]
MFPLILIQNGFLSIAVLFCSFGFASAQETYIDFPQNNVLYTCNEYKFYYSIKGVERENVVVKTTANIQVFQKDSQSFLVCTKHGIGAISLGKKVGQDTIFLEKRTYRIKPNPTPEVQLGMLQNNQSYNKNVICIQSSMSISTFGFVIQVQYYELLSCRVTLFGKDTQILHFSNTNIPLVFKNYVCNGMNHGGKILFDSILVNEICSDYTTLAESFSIVVEPQAGDPDYIKHFESSYFKLPDTTFILKNVYPFIEQIDSIINGEVSILHKDSYHFNRITKLYFRKNEIRKIQQFDEFGNLLSEIRRFNH